VDAVARRVVFDAGEVEYLCEHGQALADRLALPSGCMEFGDHASDVGRRDLVDAAGAEQREDAAELDAVADSGSRGHVDARCTPHLCRLGKRQRCGRVGEVADIGHAQSYALNLGEGDEVVFRVIEGRRAILARTPDLLDLAGSVPVPADVRGLPWEEIRRRAWAGQFSFRSTSSSRRASFATVFRMSESLQVTIMYEDGDDGWIVASFPEVPGANSQGRTREEARTNVIDALRGILELRFGGHPEVTEGADSEPLELVIGA
jgi:predicted RNase H-like HicB family nuclease